MGIERQIQIGEEKIATDLDYFEFRGKKVEPAGCGGMAVRISTAPLTGDIAKNNGIGVIGLTGICGKIIQSSEKYSKENLRVGREELKQAKEIAGGKGIIAGNILSEARGVNDFCLDDEVMHNAEMMFMGAGVERNLFKKIQEHYGNDRDAAIMVPIASTYKALRVNLLLLQRAKYIPPNDDKYTFYLELISAAAHIGLLNPRHLEDPEKAKEYLLETVAEEIATSPFRSEIRVLLGGGIVDYNDVKKVQDFGFDGTLTGTAFANTHESGASDWHKSLISEAHPDGIKTILSPAGFWANFLDSDFTQDGLKIGKLIDIETYLKSHEKALELFKQVVKTRECVTQCLKHCGKKGDARDSLAGNYCIMGRLNLAIQGSKKGIYFAGKDAYRVGSTTSAAERMRLLLEKRTKKQKVNLSL
ncbi:nitronate monooxygenase [Candidatus Gracilibacteria bacterium]|nr:nitronate monooxygenase [Candidatus Gracilibacteria bacterium]